MIILMNINFTPEMIESILEASDEIEFGAAVRGFCGIAVIEAGGVWKPITKRGQYTRTKSASPPPAQPAPESNG